MMTLSEFSIGTNIAGLRQAEKQSRILPTSGFLSLNLLANLGEVARKCA
jgi:hypothetical protein